MFVLRSRHRVNEPKRQMFSYRMLAVALLIVYLLLGMVMFAYIEKPTSECEAVVVSNMTVSLLTENKNISSSLTDMTVKLLAIKPHPTNSSLVIVFFTENGAVKSEEFNSFHDWNFTTAIFFCCTVVTAIGYGNLFPVTPLGKAMTIVYAMLGIPLFGLVANHTRTMLVDGLNWLHEKIFCLDQKFANRYWLDQEKPPLTLVALLLLTSLVTIAAPALLFSYLEGWDFLSAVYYNLITLTTIGFGDMIATKNRGANYVKYNAKWEYDLYRFFCTVWIFCGLPFISAMLEAYQVQLERILKTLIKRVDPVLTTTNRSNKIVDVNVDQTTENNNKN